MSRGCGMKTYCGFSVEGLSKARWFRGTQLQAVRRAIILGRSQERVLGPRFQWVEPMCWASGRGEPISVVWTTAIVLDRLTNCISICGGTELISPATPGHFSIMGLHHGLIVWRRRWFTIR